MTWQCPYTPLELVALNPHGFDYGDRVGIQGSTGTVSKCRSGTACINPG